jgi:hypothetical protein
MPATIKPENRFTIPQILLIATIFLLLNNCVFAQQQKKWITFKNDTGAFTVQLPVEPSAIDKELPNSIDKNGPPFRLKLYLSVDTDKMINYIIRYNNYPTGTFLADKKLFFKGAIKELATKGEIIGEPVIITKDGYEGREVKVVLAEHYNCIAQFFVRGNRTYFLLEQNVNKDQQLAPNSGFFSSFTFIPYLMPRLNEIESENGDYRISSPSLPRIKKDTANDYYDYLQNSVNYFATSPTSGGVYTMENAKISKYYRTDSIEKLYASITDKVVGYKDSLTKTDTVTINGKKGREILMTSRYTNEQKRARILIDGDDVFIMSGHLAPEELFNETSNSYFSSLIINSKSKGDLFSSKAATIITDLQSKDTTTFKKAIGALAYYKFTKDELPFIYTAIKQNYPDDTSITGTRCKMIEILRTVHDESTIKQLLAIYPDIQGKDELRARILNVIPAIDKQTGYDIYLKLLLSQQSPKPNSTYYLFYPLTDSLEYTANHFQQILTLINVPNYKDRVLNIASDLANAKNPAYDKLLKSNFTILTKDCYKDLDAFLTSKDTSKYEWSTNIFYYLNIMGHIKDEPLTDQFTSYYITKNPKGTNFSGAVVTRINNHLYINPLTINKLMDTIDNRYDVMEALYNQKEFDKIPAKYKKQDEFGRLDLYQYITADEDEGVPAKLTLLGSVFNNNSVYYAYTFLLPEREDKITYIGIAGPFKPGSTSLDFEKYNAYTSYDEKKENWQQQAKELIPKLIEQYAHK